MTDGQAASHLAMELSTDRMLEWLSRLSPYQGPVLRLIRKVWIYGN
jgi:hypothetical protein